MNRAQSTPLIVERCGCGRRGRTFIFGVKARRDCRLHHPAKGGHGEGGDAGTGRKSDVSVSPRRPFSLSVLSGHWDSNPDPRANLALTPLIRRVLFQLSYAPSKLVAVEGIEPTSLDYQSSALAIELHRETWLTRRGSNPHLTA
jgi:hypothetical protein